MKNVLILLAVIVPVVLKAQSNPNTDTIKIPFAVAKQIAIELNTCDSVKNTLDIVQFELELTKKQLANRDSLLINATNNAAGLNKQLTNQQEQADTYKQLYTQKKDDFDTVSEKLRKHKALRNFIDITASVAVGIIIYILAK